MEIGPKSLMGLSLLTLAAVLTGLRFRQAAIERADREAEALAASAQRPSTPTDLERSPSPSSSETGIIGCSFGPTRTTSVDELLCTRQKLADLGPSQLSMDPSHPARVEEMKRKIDQLLVERVPSEANVFATMSDTTPRQVLAKYAAAEDYVRKAVEDANKAKSPDEARFSAAYKALLADSDAYTLRVIDPAFIESVPWKDLLCGDLAQRWSKTTFVPGFSCRIESGVLTLTPPDTGSGQRGIASILDQASDNLRHFALDMEFTVEGTVQMFFHVNPPPSAPDDRLCERFDLRGEPGALEPGRTYTFLATYVGSTLTVESSAGGLPTRTDNASWAKRRKGGIAFVVPEGARLRVTRMRIKELR